MRVHVVSDVHGNAEALARAGDGADALIVLGDLLDFVDYHEHGNGILGTLFGADKVGTFARLRREGTREETVAFSRSLWASLDDPGAAVDEAIRQQYATLFAAMTAPTYATPGNVDAPGLWPEYAGPGIRLLDGDVADIGGLRFGFVGGGLLPDGVVPRRGGFWRPYLREREEFDAAARALSGIDVLCSHIPPALPDLTYDVVARRAEVGSAALVDVITAEQPMWSVFGHVHQPLAARARAGRTECRNVGHFKQTARPYVLRW
ncbi:metallophosphoesterase [Prauserella marina]|uniref:Calcineurin-like phosphoesterase n=1 Tax=Prauserella marina TaxID=530584 RepID=A0A222VN86_9PSEU|nr:metallophosphoesterase [Prauserella marina]ASR35385.1 metallophosphoesterase [Prauserella marina]PWV84815.1 calcineurin-like phosphoesterase family protein [Prauserella marina]SDC12432.1 Calcineurin-like phosphoesterase [Prauserella marina]